MGDMMNPYLDLMIDEIDLESVKEQLKKHEGFRPLPYEDTRGYLTIGYGTKLPITEEEAEMLLMKRLKDKAVLLAKKEPIFLTLPTSVKNAILNMAYQMGISGVLKFKKMWAALKEGDYEKAAEEMLDSRWAKQTPNRAKKLAEVVRNTYA
jgi:lysozyme